MAQPSARQVLTDAGYSADQIQRVLNGALVTGDANTVSNKDLSVAMAFVVALAPQALSDKILSGDVEGSDPQVRLHRVFHGDGSLADLAALQISRASAQQTLLTAQAGESLNLSEPATRSPPSNALQEAPNPRSGAGTAARHAARPSAGDPDLRAGRNRTVARDGGQADVGGELRKASQGSRLVARYLPRSRPPGQAIPRPPSPACNRISSGPTTTSAGRRRTC